MEYEKKYNEALERAKQFSKKPYLEDSKGIVEYIFPELKESEDGEKIRKVLIKEFQHYDKECKWGEFTTTEILAWLEKQVEPQDKGEISDGYHTFNELYYYRMLYNAAFFNMLPKDLVHKSKRHNDGEECFGGGWFIVMANLPTGQISNHYELKDWNLFQIPEKEIADKWDGHTPQEAANRLHKYLLKNQCGEQKSTRPIWKYKKDHTPLLMDSLILNKYGCVTKSPSCAIVSDVWVLDYDELAKLPKEEIEKQCEHKETLCDKCKKAQPSHSCQDITELGRCYLEHEKQSEQKPIDNVTQKIHIEKGKWYVCIKSFNLNCNTVVEKGRAYKSREDNAISGEDGRLFIDNHDGDASKYFRPWTIRDAKPGDVIYHRSPLTGVE